MRSVTVMLSLLTVLPLTGCLVVGATSSGGFFIWPGSLILTLILLLIFFALRRR